MNLNDLADRALVLFVDHQEGIAEGARTSDHHETDKTAAVLAQAAQIYGIPIVVSAIALGKDPKLTRRLEDVLGDDFPLHVRQGTDSLDDEALRSSIDATGRRTLLLAGVVTEIAVQRAALHALEAGFEARVVLDACNGASERSERASIARMVHAGVIMSSVPQTLGELATHFSDERAQQAIALLRKR